MPLANGRPGAIRLPESPRNRSIVLPPDAPTMPPLTRDRPRRRSSTLREEMQHHRQQVARGLDRVVAWTTPASDRFLDDITLTPGHSEYRAYPRIPGEEGRNSHLAEDELRHRLLTTGRHKSAQSLSTAHSGASESSGHARQEAHPSMRSSSGGGSDPGLLMLPATWPHRTSNLSPPSLDFEQPDIVEDSDGVLMNRSYSSTSSAPSSPPIIVVTPDEST